MTGNLITRRQWLALAAMAFPLSCKPPPVVTQRRAGKKGLCLSAKNRTPEKVAKFIDSVAARWIYNWGTKYPEILHADIDFIPMIYKVGDATEQTFASLKSQAPSGGYRALLGFNEPDSKTQGDTSVEQALDAWPTLEATGLRLGSPACVHPDNEWMLAFMKGVEERGLRVDFICMHSYAGPNAGAFVKRLEKVHELFKRPIWITEFAVADWEARTSGVNRYAPERIADFVRELLPQLEAMDIVERYAWFHGGISGKPLGSSKLFNPDGSLTVVGEAYRAIG